MRISVVLAYFIVIWSQPNVYADENIIVHTSYGDILGYQTSIARVFYGIPYAQPPVGELRFVLIKSFFFLLIYIIFYN